MFVRFANKLAAQQYLLQEDIQTIVKAAGDHWDWTMRTTFDRPIVTRTLLAFDVQFRHNGAAEKRPREALFGQ